MSLNPKLPRTRRSDGIEDGTQVLSTEAVELDCFRTSVDNRSDEDCFDYAGSHDMNKKPEATVELNGQVTVDECEDADSYSYGEIMWTAISMLSYIVDIGSDIYVAIIYYADEDWWWFGLTVAFIVVPSLTISVFSFMWYVHDHHLPILSSPVRCIPRMVLVFLQLGPLIRYVETVIFGLRSKWEKHEHDKKKWFRHKTWEETDSALLRLLECFMEASPQLTLQLYIIAVQGIKGHFWLAIGQIVSCVSSLCSIAWAMAFYQRALRASLDDKAKLGFVQLALMFTWRLFTVGARVIALALFASCFQWRVFVIVGVHWAIMFLWILVQDTKFCKTKLEEFFFNMIAAVVNTFDFFNLIEGHTRLRYIIYYCIVYAENCLMMVLYYTMQSSTSRWYVSLSMVAVLGLFFVGILIQFVYYAVFHPNNYTKNKKQRIQFCVDCRELTSHCYTDQSKGNVAIASV